MSNDPNSDFLEYQLAKVKTELARQISENTIMQLDHAIILKRLAEIRSQQEPLAALATARVDDREKMEAAAHYVVCGRFPSDFGSKAKETTND